MESGESSGLFERLFGGGDHQKEQIGGANASQAPADGDVAFDPGVQGASGHDPLPAMSHSIEMEVMTLRVGRRDVQVSWWVPPGRVGAGGASRLQGVIA